MVNGTIIPEAGKKESIISYINDNKDGKSVYFHSNSRKKSVKKAGKEILKMDFGYGGMRMVKKFRKATTDLDSSMVFGSITMIKVEK